MAFINWGQESPEQLEIRRRLEEHALLEQAMFQAARSAAIAGSGLVVKNWISAGNTAYIYPITDFEEAVELTNVELTREGNVLYFDSIVDIDLFCYDVWYRTSISQPLNNLGYSLGVGTELTGSNNHLYFKLKDGRVIVKFELMTQITDQSTLPTGGDSPAGTVGYGVIYSDPEGDGTGTTINDTIANNIDPLRFLKH